ncbi:hypothetical protein ILUMI_25249 [Ignelater luminosus]|uniref:Uncharacterized protein n=1 Tax=Ignelater luminosus TaxID=2038154 RepID=A0A8K0FWB2_IGNLU|nr:hypothetical protein ILUMI_25249 [Ignelater luminosus]
MLTFMIILFILFMKGCVMQECYYDINEPTEVTCSDMKTIEQIKHTLNSTLEQYRSTERIIESLTLQRCRLLNLSIDSLGFLPKLNQLEIIDSYISELSSSEEVQGLWKIDATEDPDEIHGCVMQECYYDISKPTEVTCSSMKTIEQIKHELNSTLEHYRSAARIIETLTLQRCRMLNISIDSLRFLPRLNQLEIVDSYINELSSSEELEYLWKADVAVDTDKTHGMC